MGKPANTTPPTHGRTAEAAKTRDQLVLLSKQVGKVALERKLHQQLLGKRVSKLTTECRAMEMETEAKMFKGKGSKKERGKVNEWIRENMNP